MAARARRSTRLAIDTNEDTNEGGSNMPEKVKQTTRGSSSYESSNNGVPSTKPEFLFKVWEKIYENEDSTPIKRKVNANKKKLKDSEILQELDSDEELFNNLRKNDDTGKNQTNDNYKCTLIHDNQTIKMKLRKSIGKVNYHEDAAMEMHEIDCLNKINAATLIRDQKNNKLQAFKQAAEISPRKRSKESNQEQEFQEYGVENKMYQANQIMSSPKRPKSQMDIEQTPKKNSGLINVKSTPRSTAKRKIDLSEPKNVNRISTRRSTMNHQIEDYEKCSSSDNNTKLEKEPKVILKDIAKRTNKKNSQNDQTQESGESEIENKMNNANKNSNKNSVRKSTISRSKSLQILANNSNESLYTPSKDMQKLNINKDAGTPRSSRTLVHKVNKSLLDSIPSNVSEAQVDTPRRSQRNARKRYNIEIFSDEESADSSDNYDVEDDSSDSDEQSLESDYSSAEEFQKFRKNKKILQTPRKNITTPKVKRLTKVSMNTPTKAISRMTLGTPTLDKHRRTIEITKPSTPLQKARAILHVSMLPKSLPCREEQFNDIYSFLHARLLDGNGGCIYISGVPGTGKTATVSEVIRCLKKSMTKGELPEFEYIDINGMKLSEPRQAYVQIWKQMAGETKTWEESHKLLQNKFTNSNSKRKMTLLLVDELDLLCTKRQDVVYNLLDWPTKTNAKLIVVTIANTMDLPERILMGKVTSRLGLTRLTFPPYNFKQLEEIVVSRLKGVNAFGGETVQLVARKVAAVSGDARRALDICRRAAEITEKTGRQLVNMIDVKQALDEMIASPKIQAIKHCSDMEKYFLQAVCTEVQRTGVEEVVFKNVYMHMGTLCIMDGLETPSVSEALEICARLGSWRLLLCDHSRMDIYQRLLLNVSTDDVYFATKNNV